MELLLGIVVGTIVGLLIGSVKPLPKATLPGSAVSLVVGTGVGVLTVIALRGT
jgi:hypothetical protein